jgi:hypothetical protein
MSNQTNNNNNNNAPKFGAPANPPANPPAPQGNRFGGGSRFGGAPANPPAAPAPGPASRFGGSAPRFGSRFGGREEALWTIAPLRLDAVRISLEGLGDPFHRLLGTPINAVFSKSAKVVEALGKDEDLLKRLSEVLNDSWAKYEFRGAALLYPWDDGIRKAYNQPLQPTPPPPAEKKEADSDDDDYADEQLPDWLASPAQKSSACLRAIDVCFVLNILARSRANVVVGNTPLALEPGFLEQSLLCDDPRIVTLARATGCIEENW